MIYSPVIVLKEKTLQQYNIDCDTLTSGSHQRIFVCCQKCGEEFTREWRLRHQNHSCSINVQKNDDTKLKWCNNCESFLSYQLFNTDPTKSDGLNSYCKTCFNDENKLINTTESTIKMLIASKLIPIPNPPKLIRKKVSIKTKGAAITTLI